MSSDNIYYKCKGCSETSDIPYSFVSCKKTESGFHEWEKKNKGMWVVWLIVAAIVVILSYVIIAAPVLFLSNTMMLGSGYETPVELVIAAIAVYGSVVYHFVHLKKSFSTLSKVGLIGYGAIALWISISFLINIFADGNGDIFGLIVQMPAHVSYPLLTFIGLCLFFGYTAYVIIEDASTALPVLDQNAQVRRIASGGAGLLVAVLLYVFSAANIALSLIPS